MAMTIEQQRAIAMATARQRMAAMQAPAAAAPSEDQQQAHDDQVKADYAAQPWYWKAPQAAADLALIGGDAMTGGYGDKLGAWVNSKLGSGTYDENLAQLRGETNDAYTRAGYAAIPAQAMALMNPLADAGNVVKAASYGPKAVSAVAPWVAPALSGAAYGAFNAAGHDENLGEGAASGAAGGVAGQALGALGEKIATSLMSKAPKLMTQEQLKAAAQDAYKQADMAGIVYKPEAIANLADSIKADAANFGYHPDLHPGAKVAMNELDRLAANGNVNLQGLNGARRIASKAYLPLQKDNNELVRQIVNKIDDFAQNAGPAETVMGDSAAASDALKNARDLWSRQAKLSTVEDMISAAERRAGSTGSGGNVENATRQNLRKILDSKAKSRGFTADEKDALTQAVMGTKLQNGLRLIGKASPVGNGLIGTIEGMGALGGHLAGNPIMAPAILAGAIGSTGAKLTSEAMQRAAVNNVKNMIAAGGQRAAISPTITPNRQALANAVKKLIAGGGLVLGATH